MPLATDSRRDLLELLHDYRQLQRGGLRWGEYWNAPKGSPLYKVEAD